jgi:diguanylate cyclase (GGDEF)-like protein/PAS domain S-box-containing protein
MFLKVLPPRSASATPFPLGEAALDDGVLGTLGVGIWQVDLAEGSMSVDAPWLEMLGYEPADMQAADIKWMDWVHPDDWPALQQAEQQVLKGQQPSYGLELRVRHKQGHWVWVIRRGTVQGRDENGQALAWLGRHTDISVRKQAELELARQIRLMKAVAHAQNLFIAEAEPRPVFTELLAELLDLTDSEYGFVGEVLKDPTGVPYVVLHALAGKGPQAMSRSERQRLERGELMVRDPASLMGVVAYSGEPVISNDPLNDPRSHGLPAGHRSMRSYMGLPVSLNGETVAMVGLANRPGGYRDQDVVFLQPLMISLAQIIRSWRMVEQRRRVEQALQLTLSSINQGVLRVDDVGRVDFFNDRVVSMLDIPAQVLAQRPTLRELEPYQAQLGPDAPGTFWLKTPQGKTLEIQTELVSDGGMVRTFSDVTEYIGVQEALRAGEQRHREMADQLQTILDAIPDLLFEFDAEGHYLYVGKGHPELLYTPPEGKMWSTYHDVLPPEAAAEIDAAISEATLCGSSVGHHYKLDLPDGTHWFEVSMTRRDASDTGHPLRFVMLARDITQRRLVDEQIQHLAYHDALTNLPNRRLLQDTLRRALVSAVRHQRLGALLFIDLDNFKDLNDTMGHDQGDELLQQVAIRLKFCVREADTVARLGGDEFVVLLEELNTDPATAAIEAEAVARKVQQALRQPYLLKDKNHNSTPSIGVALFGANSDTVEELLKRADLAMYRSKTEGRNTISFFDPEMQSKVLSRAALEADLRVALHQQEWRLFFQPVVDEVGHVVGAEALIRWSHPERGMVSPGEFIPVAEQTGLILQLGHWVLRRSCEYLAEWAHHEHMRHWTLAVNVSAREFRHPGFVQQVIDEVHVSGINPNRLKLEVTESMFMHDVEEIVQQMERLRAIGVRFSLDDFGTGYSSLSYLKRLPLDELKIDQSFVRDVLVDEDDAAIVRAILTLANTLGLAVVAEGVEQPGQRDFLASHGCRAFQGYLFGKPADMAKAAELAQANATRDLLGHWVI